MANPQIAHLINTDARGQDRFPSTPLPFGHIRWQSTVQATTITMRCPATALLNLLNLSTALMNVEGFPPALLYFPLPLGVHAGRARVLCRGGPRQGAVLLPYRRAPGSPALQRHVWRRPGLPEAGMDGVGGGFWCVGRDNGSVDGGTRTPKGRCNPASVSCCPDNSLRQE